MWLVQATTVTFNVCHECSSHPLHWYKCPRSAGHAPASYPSHAHTFQSCHVGVAPLQVMHLCTTVTRPHIYTDRGVHISDMMSRTAQGDRGCLFLHANALMPCIRMARVWHARLLCR